MIYIDIWRVLWYDVHGGADMLYITEDGKQALNDFRSISYAVLFELQRHNSITICDLMTRIQRNHIEFRYIPIRTFATTIGDLQKQGLVANTYGD